MTYGYTILGMVVSILIATYAWLMYVFIASAGKTPMKRWHGQITNSGIYSIPVSGVVAAILTYLFFRQNFSSFGYLAVLLPAAVLGMYLAFLFYLEKSR
ncbi:hypothetical protein ACFSKL_22505 [Belliella marina]|uniref:Uncharacterized protein n=1 Tax=Belliella marina TaxID=1644146 RepID=A0ABW4VTQ4_9BACT